MTKVCFRASALAQRDDLEGSIPAGPVFPQTSGGREGIGILENDQVSGMAEYAFETPRRYGRLASLFGRRPNRDLIVGHWSEIEPVIGAM